MRQQSHGFPVNGLNERIIFRESECGQRAGIWAMMCPALDVTNGAIVIHTQRLKSDPGGNLLS